jgi:hypothetical protein
VAGSLKFWGSTKKICGEHLVRKDSTRRNGKKKIIIADSADRSVDFVLEAGRSCKVFSGDIDIVQVIWGFRTLITCITVICNA